MEDVVYMNSMVKEKQVMEALFLLQQDCGFITLDWQYFRQFEILLGN
jgi:hypothetical protein